MYQSDHQLETKLFSARYESYLNSEDNFNQELPLDNTRPKGGTMALWRREIDQYITIQSCPSSAILPLLFAPPTYTPSVHITVYLPTAGKDTSYVEEIVKLVQCIHEISSKYPEANVYIRGDANANQKNTNRQSLLDNLCMQWDLMKVSLDHTTYHHFLGNGSSDSELDVLYYSKEAKEQLVKIFCIHDYSLLTSHHDALVSSFHDFAIKQPQPTNSKRAPRIPNNRVKINWTERGSELFQEAVAPALLQLRNSWLDPDSTASFSILLQATNSLLDTCARATNPFVNLSKPFRPASTRKPPYLIKSERSLRTTHKLLRKTPVTSCNYKRIKDAHSLRKKYHMQLLRYSRMQEGYKRDSQLDLLCSKSPQAGFKFLKQIRRNNNKKISKLNVDGQVYSGASVPDGIFRSIETLKTEPVYPSNCLDFSVEYQLIRDICSAGREIPALTKEKSKKILFSLRKNVNDLYSITALHYINAGEAGIDHFYQLLNVIINNVNLSNLEELNSIYACILYKGQGKDRQSSRSYRTISTCPLLAKAIDCYLRELCLDSWDCEQASTQYQGGGMSHELACLLLTETLQFSILVSKRPVFALFLDAKSAFDRVIRQILIRNLYSAGTDDQRLIYIDERLKNRYTYCEFDREMMGPIRDSRGLEQGGISSSDMYKLYNNEQAIVAQSSGLGVPVYDTVVSCISLADDAVLLANGLVDLGNLLSLTLQYCKKYDVTLVTEKLQLVAFHKNIDDVLEYEKTVIPLSVDGKIIAYSNQASHLGVVRSAQHGNLVSIMERLAAHRRQIFSLLPSGLAFHHCSNPAANIRVQQIYCLPVLMSGLASLVLTKAEIKTISSYYKTNLLKLMKLLHKTPDSAVFFLAGTLPAEAQLHLRQLGLFSMVCQLDNNILKDIAINSLSLHYPNSKSWFLQIRSLCQQYGLSDPLFLLENPPPKIYFRNQCRLKILEYWHEKLSSEAVALSSLRYLKPAFLSL